MPPPGEIYECVVIFFFFFELRVKRHCRMKRWRILGSVSGGVERFWEGGGGGGGGMLFILKNSGRRRRRARRGGSNG